MKSSRTWLSYTTISIQRSPAMAELYKDQPNVIRKGDLLHCDVGIRYLRLCTDMQWHAYVCLPGEQDAPEGLKNALARAVRLADVFMGEFKEGLTGHQIAANTIQKATAEGLRPRLYSHPIGYYSHDTGTAIEFSSTTAVPEWNNKDVVISYEEEGVFTREGTQV
ncbi:MAG: M24 family metallopeptidase [Bacteroidales bacterium]